MGFAPTSLFTPGMAVAPFLLNHLNGTRTRRREKFGPFLLRKEMIYESVVLGLGRRHPGYRCWVR